MKLFRNFVVYAAVLGIFSVGLLIARADCQGTTTIICTGTDPNGVGAGDNVTVIVEDSAVVEDSIYVGDDSTVTNNGEIDAEDEGIWADENATVTNNGDIYSDEEDGINVDENGVVVNNGSIYSDEEGGIDTQEDSTVINNGDIDADNNGIEVEDNSTVINNGTIYSDHQDGINAENDATIINNGDINADEDGIYADDDAVIINNGYIYADDDDGIEADSYAYVVNNGHIDAWDDGIVVGGDSTVINNGTIDSGYWAISMHGENVIFINNGEINSYNGYNAVDGSDGDDTVINNGTIIGTDGAIEMRDGDDVVTLGEDSLVIGLIDGGDDFDTLNFVMSSYSQEDLDTFAQYVSTLPTSGCPCTVIINGQSYTYTNFEQLMTILDLNLNRPLTICDQNDVLVLKNRLEGYVDVYTGFSAMPNGFWVGRITADGIEAGLTRFMDAGPHNPGYAVAIQPEGSAYRVTVVLGDTVVWDMGCLVEVDGVGA